MSISKERQSLLSWFRRRKCYAGTSGLKGFYFLSEAFSSHVYRNKINRNGNKEMANSMSAVGIDYTPANRAVQIEIYSYNKFASDNPNTVEYVGKNYAVLQPEVILKLAEFIKLSNKEYCEDTKKECDTRSFSYLESNKQYDFVPIKDLNIIKNDKKEN